MEALSLTRRSVTEFPIANALPSPILVIGPRREILYANPAAEQFFDTGAAILTKQNLVDLLPFGSPMFQLVEQARRRDASAAERDVDLSTPKHGERIADVTVTPLPEPPGTMVVALSERSLAQRMDRQLMAQGAVRSMHGMAAVLAHEIKNPAGRHPRRRSVAGGTASPAEREMTQLIVDETDRIRGLIDRMEAFGDTRTFQRKPVNIHEVLDRVRRIAESGFASGAKFVESFDPSLPPVAGDRDQLIQVFLNLVRNAVDAVPDNGGEINVHHLLPAGRAFRASTSGERVSLPLEVTVRDNGIGVPSDLMPYIFDPFVTTKAPGFGPGTCAGRQDRGRPWRRASNAIPFLAAPFSGCCCRSFPVSRSRRTNDVPPLFWLPTTTAPSARCCIRRWRARAMTCAPPERRRACGKWSPRARAILPSPMWSCRTKAASISFPASSGCGPNLPIVVMSAQNTLLTAITAAERGAFEYLPKPFDLKELTSVVQRALASPAEQAREQQAGEQRRRSAPDRPHPGDAGDLSRHRAAHPDRSDRDDHGRIRHRQGAGGARAARLRHAAVTAVRRRQHGGDSEGAGRKRIVRP